MKFIKKLLCLTIALATMVSLLSSNLNVSAATIYGPVVTVEKVTAVGGDTVEVQIKVTENPGFAAMSFTIFYDKDVFTYSEMRRGGVFTDYTIANYGEKGYLAFTNCENRDVKYTGLLMTLVFTVKEDAAAAFYPVEIKNSFPDKYGSDMKRCFANWDGDTLIPTIVNGGIEVGKSCKNGWHSYGEWVTTQQPSCTIEGSKKQTCKNCPHTKSESIPVIDHDYEDIRTVDRVAISSLMGIISFHCKNCGDVTNKSYFSKKDWDKGQIPTTVGEKITAGEWNKILERLNVTEQEVIVTPEGTTSSPQTVTPPETPDLPESFVPPDKDEKNNVDATEILSNAKKESGSLTAKIHGYLFGTENFKGIIPTVISSAKSLLNNTNWIIPIVVFVIVVIL